MGAIKGEWDKQRGWDFKQRVGRVEERRREEGHIIPSIFKKAIGKYVYLKYIHTIKCVCTHML